MHFITPEFLSPRESTLDFLRNFARTYSDIVWNKREN